ncbi:MFS-type transporter clz9-like [Haliotis rubra]|uniref:MFS-type transporter clz9-like n=1 Tax=Haliotis rubra TaxID=36100 RepID=UPI001EE5D187|nr:MFS-type transporter clz9-like [Haliotis rubra]
MTKAYLSVVEDGASVRGAAGKYGIPEATLRDRVRGYVNPEVVKSGIPPLLNQEEELHLVEHLKVMAASGYGYSRAEVVDMASTYAVALGKRDEDHHLTLMWFYNFMKRWPELKVCKPRERIYNVDEKELNQNHSPPSIATSLEPATTPSAVVSGKGSTVTVIGCGHQIPQYYVFPGKRMRPQLLKECTPGSAGTVTESGWSNTEVYRYYLQHHFAKFVQGRDSKKKILILYGGHMSHISLPLIDWAKEHTILLFILPAHTSHVLQPLDVGCFDPFERIYNNECHQFMRSNACTGIDRYSVCDLACRAYGKALSPDNLRSSFRKSGIYPFEPLAVDKSAFIPAKVLKKAALRT